MPVGRVPCAALALVALGLTTTGARAQTVDPRDQSIADACGPLDEALGRVATEVARRRLLGQRVADELAPLVRQAGHTSPWPRSLTFAGQPVDRAQAAVQVSAFARKVPARWPVRCGVASLSDAEGHEVVSVVAAPDTARVAPFARSLRTSTWFTVDVQVQVPASGARVIVLGPSGAPRSIPSSWLKGRVQGRFVITRPGRWLAQVVADTPAGPLPVAELEVYGGPAPSGSSGHEPAPGESATGADDETALVAMVNAARQSEGLGALAPDESLARLARAHAAAMARAGLVGHDVGDGDPEQRASAAGVVFTRLGENVAHALSLPAAHRALWSSPSHRQNLLTPGYRQTGVAALRDPDGSVWVVELFATP